MKPLAIAAVLAGFEVPLVISSHLGRNSGDVVTPTGEDIAYNLINALCHLMLSISLPQIAPNSTTCPERFQTIRTRASISGSNSFQYKANPA